MEDISSNSVLTSSILSETTTNESSSYTDEPSSSEEITNTYEPSSSTELSTTDQFSSLLSSSLPVTTTSSTTISSFLQSQQFCLHQLLVMIQIVKQQSPTFQQIH